MMILEKTYQEAIDIAESIRCGVKTDKILFVIFVMSSCEVCGPWLEKVITPLARTYSDEVDFVTVAVDKNEIIFPPPQVPSTYFFVPGDSAKSNISRPGPGHRDLVEKDLVNLKKSQDG
jgi:hypothetical protein